MMENQKEYFIGLVIGVLLMAILWAYNSTQTKYKMNLKCVQGELYEEIRPNFYVKSHLECFEQRTF
jgi:hypothetical protein